MEWWNGMVEWNGGMEWWNGIVKWNSGMPSCPKNLTIGGVMS